MTPEVGRDIGVTKGAINVSSLLKTARLIGNSEIESRGVTRVISYIEKETFRIVKCLAIYVGISLIVHSGAFSSTNFTSKVDGILLAIIIEGNTLVRFD